MFRRRKETTKITIETREITTIRLSQPASGLRYCTICRRDVGCLSRAQSAQILQADELLLDALFASNEIHGIDEAAICANSLARHFP